MNWNKVVLQTICHFMLPIEIIMLTRTCKTIHRLARPLVLQVFRARLHEKFPYVLDEHSYIYGSFLLYLLAGTPYADIDINVASDTLYNQLVKEHDAENYDLYHKKDVRISNFGNIQLIYNNVDFASYILSTDMDICMNAYTTSRLSIHAVDAIFTRRARVVNVASFTYSTAPHKRVRKYRLKGFTITATEEIKAKIHKTINKYHCCYGAYDMVCTLRELAKNLNPHNIQRFVKYIIRLLYVAKDNLKNKKYRFAHYF